MNTEQHILACIDGSAVTESVCDYAAWYASRLNLPVGLLHVSDVPASNRRDLSGAIGINSRQFLLEELTQLDEQRAKVANSYSNALVKDAKSHIQSSFNGVDVKIYQRHGEDHKDSRINIGSQIETVARASSVPVLICSEKFKTSNSYMIAFDGSKTAIKAVDMIAKSPLLKGLQGHIVMIGNDDATSKHSLVMATEKLTTSGFTVEAHHLTASDAVDGLLAFQQQNAVDIIVIGAYGHSKFQQLFIGSTTTKIIAKTLSPVILIR